MVACATPSWREAPGGWGLHLFGSLPCPWYLKGHRWPQALIYVSHSGPAAVPSVSYTVFCLILKTTLWGRYYWCSFYRHGSWKALSHWAFLSPKLFPWTSDLIWLSSLQPVSQPSALLGFWHFWRYCYVYHVPYFFLSWLYASLPSFRTCPFRGKVQ